MVGAEIVILAGRPSLPNVLNFYEYACTLPLNVHECVNVRTSVVLGLFLIIELPYGWIPAWRVELCVLPCVRSDLHLHYVSLDIELNVVTRIDGNGRHWNRVFIGGNLEEDSVVQVQEIENIEILSHRS